MAEGGTVGRGRMEDEQKKMLKDSPGRCDPYFDITQHNSNSDSLHVQYICVAGNRTEQRERGVVCLSRNRRSKKQDKAKTWIMTLGQKDKMVAFRDMHRYFKGVLL